MALDKRYTDDTDPLGEYAADHDDDDPDDYLEAYLENRDKANNGGLSVRTRESYSETWYLWCRWMKREAPDRAPIMPTKGNVAGFIDALDGGDAEIQRPRAFRRGSVTDDDVPGLSVLSINRHASILERIFRTLAGKDYLPRVANPGFDAGDSDTKMVYNPFTAGVRETDLTARVRAARSDSAREYPHVSWDEIRDALAGVTNYRDKCIIALGFKLNCRAGELCNLTLSDLHIGYDSVHEHYPSMGTVPALADHGHEHAVYIPSSREGNKSVNDKIIPLDGEARRLLYAYLLVRPDVRDGNGEPVPWLFLTETNNDKMAVETVTRVWKEHFERFDPPEDSDKATVRSHFARHKATSYWSDDPDMSWRLLKNLRGDAIGSQGADSGGAIDNYLHANYSELEPIYRARPPRLLD